MIITNESNNSSQSQSQFQQGAIFIHKFIHQLESDLSLNITLNAYSNPDTLVFDTTNGDISLNNLNTQYLMYHLRHLHLVIILLK